jgi:hypothetical protein
MRRIIGGQRDGTKTPNCVRAGSPDRRSLQQMRRRYPSVDACQADPVATEHGPLGPRAGSRFGSASLVSEDAEVTAAQVTSDPIEPNSAATPTNRGRGRISWAELGLNSSVPANFDRHLPGVAHAVDRTAAMAS